MRKNRRKMREADINKKELKPTGRVTKRLQLWCEALFLVLMFMFLGVYNGDLLFREQALSFFLGNSIFADETMWQSSGLLVWVSRFLMQLAYYPALGGLLLSLLLTLAAHLTATVAKPQTVFHLLLCFAGPVLAAVAHTSAGYGIFDLYDNAFPVELELGMVLMLLLALGVLRLWTVSASVAVVTALVAAMVLQPCMGLFAWVAVLLVAAVKFSGHRRMALILAGVGATVMMAEAALLGKYVFHEDFSAVLLSPLPSFYFAEVTAYSLLAVLFTLAAAVAGSVMGPKESGKNRWDAPEKQLLIGLGGVALLAAVGCFLSFRDANFRTLLRMQRQVEAQDWDGVLETAERVEHPTRPIAACRYTALEEKGMLQTRLFDFPVRYEPLNTTHSMLNELIINPSLFFYSSMLNASYRWAMEAWVHTGKNFQNLQLMTMYALVRGEKNLAQKYIDLMKQSMFYGKWAAEHEQYIENRGKLFADYPAFRMAIELEPKINVVQSATILPDALQAYDRLDYVNFERRLLLDLYKRDTKKFMEDFSVVVPYYQKHPAPVYFQEVLALYAMSSNVKFKVQPQVEARVKQFVAEARPYANSREAGAEKLKKYQGTYPYFLLFGNPFPKDKEK